jgi:hypothetical protein
LAARQQQTKLDIVLDAKDPGAFLARYGYADGLKGAPARIEGQLGWSGAPHEFDFNTLNGAFASISVRAASPSSSRARQAARRAVAAGAPATRHARLQRRLQRRIRVRRHQRQRADRERRHVDDGPQARRSGAKVDISGETDLAKETQRLTVRVQPSLSSSVSAGAALLFLANPLVGAVMGPARCSPRPCCKTGREDLSLRVHGDRRLVGSHRREERQHERVRRRRPCPRPRATDDRRRHKMRVAAVQTVSGGDVEANLAQAEPLIRRAAAEGARLVVCRNISAFSAREHRQAGGPRGGRRRPQQAFLARLAQEHAIWLVGGTVPIASGDPERVRSACLVYGPDGRRVARYDKIHLFAFARGRSVTTKAGRSSLVPTS